MILVTPGQLRSAASSVARELDSLGIYDERLRSVEVRLAPLALDCLGWWDGEIRIPAVSLPRLGELFGRARSSLREVLRHEFGHALADTHRGLVRSSRFVEAFGAPHYSGVCWEYDPEHHVSPYASTLPMEDFAETFAAFVRRAGNLPPHADTVPIRRKWRFLRGLCGAVRRGVRRW
ncbi:MAG TPA: hypothetical protein PLU30_16795 [Verrucomicrobiae bacterium]|nr:hypothetical protein [Verrucomicrobiae bacterium]